MAAKFFLVLCASALFVKAISSQCVRGPYNAGIVGNGMIADGIGLAVNELGYGPMAANALAYDAFPLAAGYGPMAANALAYDALPLAAGYGPGLAYGNVAPASGGAFPVTCSSPIAPTGVSVVSENAIEGILAVTGELPVLAAVALEGALPTVGSGSIVYGCGNGAVGIVSEGIDSLTAPAARLGYGNALAAELGYGAPLAGGLGYRGLAGVGPVVGPGCGCGI